MHGAHGWRAGVTRGLTSPTSLHVLVTGPPREADTHARREKGKLRHTLIARVDAYKGAGGGAIQEGIQSGIKQYALVVVCD